jgi:hypothetical protein
MQNNQFILDAVKGEPNSLTSIAYHTGVIIERQRIIKLLKPFSECDACKNGNVTSDCSAELADHLIDLIQKETK